MKTHSSFVPNFRSSRSPAAKQSPKVTSMVMPICRIRNNVPATSLLCFPGILSKLFTHKTYYNRFAKNITIIIWIVQLRNIYSTYKFTNLF